MQERCFHDTVASNGTFIGIWAPEKENHEVLQSIFDMLRCRGWTIGPDHRVLKNYPAIAHDHFEGRKGSLLFKAEQHPATSSLEFFQEINVKNRCGGQYDFNKLIMMPYLIRCQFLVELKYIRKLLLEAGYADHSKPALKTAKEKIDFHIMGNRQWHEQGEDNLLDYNASDKDGRCLKDGQVKYFRDHKGRLMRGTVYHHINNMWWVLINNHWYINLAAFELFDLTSENRVRKVVRRSGHHNPKSRWMPAPKDIARRQKDAKDWGAKGRVDASNKFLKYLYEIDWMSRCFQFVLKDNGRLGLLEPEGKPNFVVFGIPRSKKTYSPPRQIPLYPTPGKMSGTESGWIKNLREYIVHGPGPRVSAWFCTDRNGEGGNAYIWPVVREKLIKMGAMIPDVSNYGLSVNS